MLSVGSLLQNQRIKKGYSLADVEKHTKVRVKFLEAIEKDNWDFFSSKIYVTGILKNYARFLELDHKKILAFFRREYERKDDVRFKRRVSSSYLASDTGRFTKGLIGLIIILFIVYFSYQLSLYVRPPQILIIEPETELFKRQERVKVVGKTEKDATITILGERVFQNKEGFFEFDLPLNIGTNKLLIEVTGANGKKASITKQYLRTQ